MAFRVDQRVIALGSDQDFNGRPEEKAYFDCKNRCLSNMLTNGKLITFTHDNVDTDKTLDQPFTVIPNESEISIEGNKLETEVPANCFAIYKFTNSSK